MTIFFIPGLRFNIFEVRRDLFKIIETYSRKLPVGSRSGDYKAGFRVDGDASICQKEPDIILKVLYPYRINDFSSIIIFNGHCIRRFFNRFLPEHHPACRIYI